MLTYQLHDSSKLTHFDNKSTYWQQ